MPTLPAPIEVEASGEFLGNDGAWSPFLIRVGNPPTELRLLASTETPEAWVVFPQGCNNQTDANNCTEARGGVFDVESSKTWTEKRIFELGAESNLGYTGNSDNGEYGLDTVAIGVPGRGNVTVDQQLIAGIATKDFFLGNVGLADRQLAFADGTQGTGLMAQLKSKNLIPSLSYGYTAGASYKQSNASLTLGGYDASRFTPNDVTFTFGNKPLRSKLVALQAVVATDSNSETPLLDQPILALVDSTVPHIWLPEQSCKEFEKAFGITHDIVSDLYLINDTIHDALIKRDASIKFELSNVLNGGPSVNITLPYASFDLNVANTVPYVRSPSRYFPLRRAQNDSQYTLGRTFFQESFLLVNYESQNFSISQSLVSKDSSRYIVPIRPAETQTATSSPTTSPISPTSTASSTLPPITKSTSHPSNSLGTPAIAGIAIAIVLLVIAGGIGVWLLIKRKRASKRETPELAAHPTYPHDKAQAELGDGESGQQPGSSNDQKGPRTSVEEVSNEKILTQQEINIMDGNSGIHGTHYEVGGSEVLTPELPSPDPLWLGPHEMSDSDAQLMRSELSTPEPGWVAEMPSPEMASTEMPSPEIGGTAAGERSPPHATNSSTLLPPDSAHSKHRPRSRRPVHVSIDSSESEGGGTRDGKAPASARRGPHSRTYTAEPFEARQPHGSAHDRVPSSASSRQRPQHMRVDSTDSESAFPLANFKSIRSTPAPAHLRVDSSDSESFTVLPRRHASLPTRPPHRRLDSKDSTDTMETRLEQSPPGSPWPLQGTWLARDRPTNQSSQEALVSPGAASVRSGLRSPEPLERELMEEDEDEDRSTDSETKRRE